MQIWQIGKCAHLLWEYFACVSFLLYHPVYLADDGFRVMVENAIVVIVVMGRSHLSMLVDKSLAAVLRGVRKQCRALCGSAEPLQIFESVKRGC